MKKLAISFGIMLCSAGAYASVAEPIAPKVMVVSMFKSEAENWIKELSLTEKVAVPGLSEDFPDVLCNNKGTCMMTTSMGHANAAATTMALVLSKKFDLKDTYFLIAGIGGINPRLGTLGTPAWAHYLVDFGLQMEIDAREIPSNWDSGYFGVHANSPNEKPKDLQYKTEIFELDKNLQEAAFIISSRVQLVDSDQAKKYRSQYTYAPANQPPQVAKCDTLTGDTWWSGTRLAQRAEVWTRFVSDGKAHYCTTQQEDNATYEALRRGGEMGLIDVRRIAVVRGGSNFDRPHTESATLSNVMDLAASGGYPISLRNVFLAANSVNQEIITHWDDWKNGVPNLK